MCRRGALALALVAAVAAVAGAAEEWLAARPDYPWTFPRDHWARPGYRLEWWYLTGHLAALDEPGRRFGYQLTLFRVGLARERPGLDSGWSTRDLVMGHAAVSDLAGGRHLFGEVLYRAIGLLGGFGEHPDPRLAWSRGPAGTAEEWWLRWNGEAFDFAAADRGRGFAFRLGTRPVKPLVLQGPNGFSRKAEAAGAASQYYSFTRLRTEGTVAVGEREWRVAGESWMDREFSSSQLGERQVGWDWFSLQLADGRELMLYLLRDRAGALDFGRGTLVDAGGRARYLEPSEWRVRATAQWTSAETGARYPARWMVEVPAQGVAVEVVPELADQENRSRLVKDLFYWEGAVRVLGLDGRPAGQGYVELTGYGKSTRPGV
jgi:predicted secreted hydrolase